MFVRETSKTIMDFWAYVIMIAAAALGIVLVGALLGAKESMRNPLDLHDWTPDKWDSRSKHDTWQKWTDL